MTTEIEEALTRSLHQGVAEPGWPQGDVRAAIAQGQRLRRRSRRAVVAGVAATLVVAGAGWQLRPEPVLRPEPAEPPVFASGWTRLPDFPLSPRSAPWVVWTGEELVVAGGDTGVPCTTDGECQELSDRDHPAYDAAAYDPQTGEWRSIANLPQVSSAQTPVYEVGGTLVAGIDRDWYSYDADADEWRSLPRPDRPVGGLVRSGGSLAWGEMYDPDQINLPNGSSLTTEGRNLVSLDVDSGEWTVLPTDGLSDDFFRFNFFPTDRGLLAVGIEPAGGVVVQGEDWGAGLDLVSFLLEGGRWTRLPDSGVAARSMTHWTGMRLVSDTTEFTDDSEDWSLDPFTGATQPFDPPVEVTYDDNRWPAGGVDGELVVRDAVLYDLSTGERRELGRPDTESDFNLGTAFTDGYFFVAGGARGPLDYATESETTSEVWVWSL